MKNKTPNENEISKEVFIEEKATRFKSDLTFYLVLVGIVLLTVFLRCFVISTYSVSGTSMYPTLNQGDFVWVNKLKTPERGDIVVVYDKQDDKALIKRVVAIDGDKLTVKWVDGGYVLVIETSGGDVFEERYDGVDIPPMRADRLGVLGNVAFVVTDGVFVMGDNRNDSKDSRFLSDPIFDKNLIIGVVIGVK